jgi:hypothetical protein
MVLYGLQTWSLTIKEEHRLGVFGNKVLMKMFGTKEEWKEGSLEGTAIRGSS